MNVLWQEMKRFKHSYVLLLPYFIIFAIFTVVPVVISLAFSFTYFNMLEAPRFIGAQNYARLLLEDDVFLIALKNTLLIAFVTGPISYVACFLFAWVINEMSPTIRTVMTLLFYAPSISGNAFIVWTFFFSGDSYGYLNGFLIGNGIIHEPINWLQDPQYMIWIVMIVQLWLSLGVGFLAFIAGLQGLDKTLIEAGLVDGIRNRWQELWFITLPSMRPMLMFGAVMQITSSFAVADVSMLLVGFPSTRYAAHTVVLHLVDFGTIRYEMGYASAIATVLFLLMIGTNLVVQKLLRKVGV